VKSLNWPIAFTPTELAMSEQSVTGILQLFIYFLVSSIFFLISSIYILFSFNYNSNDYISLYREGLFFLVIYRVLFFLFGGSINEIALHKTDITQTINIIQKQVSDLETAPNEGNFREIIIAIPKYLCGLIYRVVISLYQSLLDLAIFLEKIFSIFIIFSAIFALYINQIIDSRHNYQDSPFLIIAFSLYGLFYFIVNLLGIQRLPLFIRVIASHIGETIVNYLSNTTYMVSVCCLFVGSIWKVNAYKEAKIIFNFNPINFICNFSDHFNAAHDLYNMQGKIWFYILWALLPLLYLGWRPQNDEKNTFNCFLSLIGWSKRENENSNLAIHKNLFFARYLVCLTLYVGYMSNDFQYIWNRLLGIK
jgi:hypothetical protein